MKEINTMSRRTVLKLFGVLSLGSGFAAGAASFGRSFEEAGSVPRTPGGRRILTAYYSRSGNTAKIAEYIRRATAARVFEVVPSVPYPDDYDDVVSQAKKEISAGFRPELKTKPESMADYDIIFVGSPCWWATMAPPVAAFLASNDFSGKTVVPFMTHEGSGLGRYVDDVRKLCPDSRILDGRAFRGGQASEAQEDVEGWIRGLNFPG